MSTLSFFVHGKPAPGGSKKGFHNPKTGRVVIVDDCKRNKPWRESVKWAALEAMKTGGLTRPLSGPLRVTFRFLVNRPKGHFGSGKNAAVLKLSAPLFPTTKPDVLKLSRSTEDALTGIAYEDDSQIVTEILHKRFVAIHQAIDPGCLGEGAEIKIETM
jgi:Holliday junction resolvase RusA-like endonuclease